MKSFFFILILSFPVFAQISPGDLTNFHSNLEGMSNCTKCHEIGQKVPNSKCLSCHSEIKELINANRGFHAGSDVKRKECAGCHNEHHGRNFRIINFNEDNFNHNKTGFNLSGAHSKKDCKDCHQEKFISDKRIRKESKTYLGLNQNCNSCHEDIHKNSLGKDCASCHNTEKFSEVIKFDHNKAAFKLLGAHQNIECSKCHPKETINGKESIKLKGLSFGNCSSCHTDVHKGAFGSDCKLCHSVEGFYVINKKTFDHSKTRFPLIGKHQNVKCNDCHKGINKDRPFFTNCTNCHSDYHKGEFDSNNQVINCKKCHSELGFSPSNFTLEDHNKTKFIIDGSHLAVACRECHFQNDQWKFRDIGTKCQNCHKNVHGTELSKKYLPENKCESCHQTSNWKNITFNHNSTDFALLGKHKTVNCGNCHYREVNNIKVFHFASLTSDCVQCHIDIHFGQFKSNGAADCLGCHAFNDWKAERFDHSKAKFKNDGAHQKLLCSKCHERINENGKSYILYKLKDFRCANCHAK